MCVSGCRVVWLTVRIAQTPLIAAIESSKKDIVELLCSHPDINVNEERYHVRAFVGCTEQLRLMCVLCQQDGMTPLMIASQKGLIGMVKVLLRDPHVNVNAGDASGLTAVGHAQKNGHKSVVQALKAVGGVETANTRNAGISIPVTHGNAASAAAAAAKLNAEIEEID